MGKLVSLPMTAGYLCNHHEPGQKPCENREFAGRNERATWELETDRDGDYTVCTKPQ